MAEAPATVAGAAHRRTLSPYQLLAVLWRSLGPMLDGQEAYAWAALAKASHWAPRDLERLKARAEKAAPVALLPHLPRLVKRRASAA